MTHGNLSIRPATGDDAELLFRIYASTRTEELAVTGWPDEQKEAFLRMQFGAQDADYRSRMPAATFDVIEEDGRPVGRLYLDERPAATHVADIALLPEARGRGIGATLLGEVIERAASRGAAVTIYVERVNPARRLYDRLGFQLVEESDVYLLMRRPVQ